MRNFRIFFRGLLCVLLAVAMTGSAACSGGAKDGEEGFHVVASFTPVYALTLAVTDGAQHVTVDCMTSETTGCPHDYQLTPADMQKVETADFLVLNGAGMESSFMDKIFSQYPDLPTVESADGIQLLHEGEDGHQHTDEQETYNPHTWLSIWNAADQVDAIATALSQADPANSQVYAANAAAFRSQVEALDSSYRARLEGLSHKKIMTFHAAFAYLAEDYGLGVTAVIESSPGTAPDPQTLQELIDTVHAQGITAIFTEPQYPDSTAQVIAEATGAKIFTLDPLVTGNMNKDSYLEGMEENFKTLIEALS